MEILNNVSEPPRIRVVVRKRPLTSKEVKRQDQDVLDIIDEGSLTVKELKTKVDLTKYIEEHYFAFDNAFEYTATNQDIYQECVLPLVGETFKGAKTTCFAYGQTGSGKTFTMMGTQDGSNPGLYLLAAYDIIQLLNKYEDLELYLSFYEIYCGKLYDLLNNKEVVQCREDSKQKVNIIGLTEKKALSVENIMESISMGLESRTSGCTGANQDSSRSHAILQMQLKVNKKVFGKMSFIDLAGSERGADTINTNKQTKLDGAEINKSLLALKECIRALDLEKKHTPFRGSKLTQVLKDSFTGNSKTTMIANVSPANSCCEHTLNTLRYADRVKELKKDQQFGEKKKEDFKAKELMLARQGNNTKKIEINQATLKPKLANDNTVQKPTLKQPGQTKQINQTQNNFYTQQQQQQNSQSNHNNQNNNQQILQNQNKQPIINQQQKMKQQTQSQERSKIDSKIPIPSTFQKKEIKQQSSFNKPKSSIDTTSKASSKQSNIPQIKRKQQQKISILSYLPLLQEMVPTYEELEEEYKDDSEKLCNEHEKLIEQILEEEEQLINGHRRHIDDLVDLVKNEMGLLNDVDKPGSDVDIYVNNLDQILLNKIKIIEDMRNKLVEFNKHLKTEECMAKLYQHQCTFNDIEQDENLDDDDNLLD